ncbi:beta/gamma crystallin domain-containing protein [Streptomyces sp. URMC 126]|uniref:beta/gamma crystallin domain-containing protein n=1 Tax=Streptomyces sp. URMC 126 TaxID=3423401 RepID=UPI003F1D9187
MNDDQVTFYTGRDYTGDAHTYDIGAEVRFTREDPLNDAFLSVKVGRRARVLAWQHGSQRGEYREWESDRPDIADIGGLTRFKVTDNSVPAERYDVAPGGPPDVLLVPGGGAGFPGVVVRNTGVTPVGSRTVTAELPADKGLQWGVTGLPDYQLTLLDGGVYPGTLSSDGRTLFFDGVALDIPPHGERVMWVAVGAVGQALSTRTALRFTVGERSSDSTPVRVSRSPFAVEPGGPPDVVLHRGGAVGYPGVRLTAGANDPSPPQTVTVTLPPDTRLVWGRPGHPDDQLTVLDEHGTATVYTGKFSEDGRTLTFEDVGPGLSGAGSHSVMWVDVSAAEDAEIARTALSFTVGERESASTPVIVAAPPAFAVEPGGPPDVTVGRGGPPHYGYPGVRVRNTGSSPLVADVKVTATLPDGRGLAFAAEGGPDYLLTVWCPDTGEVRYPGRRSDDEQSLTVDRARLSAPAGGTVTLWVAIAAAPHAPVGSTALAFAVGDEESASTPVHVTAAPGE